MQETLINQGLTLMLYGMGTVFVFLSLLVFATLSMSKLLSKFSPDQKPPEQKPPGQKPQTPANFVDHSVVASKEVMAAIKAAIKLHRNR